MRTAVAAITAIVLSCANRDDATPIPLAAGGADGVSSRTATGTVVVGVGASLAVGGDGGSCGEVEVACNGFDDDCDPSTPDVPDTDEDGDGHGPCDDCNDQRADIHPGAVEHCQDAVDQDCDGLDPVCPRCGDGTVDPGEVCDDGNEASGDGCRADCLGVEVCGDGLADLATEQCDPPQDGACPGACVSCSCTTTPWRFVDVTAAAGITHHHAFDTAVNPPSDTENEISGGIAAGDYDGDGWIDLYAVGGHLGTNTLWRNTGTGTFVEVAAAAGVAVSGVHGSGPAFVDLDGDGGLDLFVAGLVPDALRVFRNRMDGTFEDVTAASGLMGDDVNLGSAFGDYDRDGDLDMAMSHWGTLISQAPVHLWRNEGGLTFASAGVATGVDAALTPPSPRSWTFTPTFSDYDDDGWPDLLFVSDFGGTRILHNDGGAFSDATTSAIDDENGMGSAVGDYDNDGDLDWFVSSIWDPNGYAEHNWGVTGNRLYQNQGDGTFVDVSASAGVRKGWWGWGACFADFNGDGHLDIFHTNGLPDAIAFEFQDDPSVLFISNGDGTFTERAWELGLVHTGQGRGVACFDYDADGDVDIVIFDNGDDLHLFENRLPPGRHHLSVRLQGAGANTQAIGARVTISAGGLTQTREIRSGSNYVSQDPAIAHFGLDGASTVDTVTVRWPNQALTVLTGIAADQQIVIAQP